MSPEEIVRALAARPAPADRDYLCCLLCDHPTDHEPDCPWRQAVEWAAADPANTETRPPQ